MYKLAILFIFCVGHIYAQDGGQNGYVKLLYPNGKVSSEGNMINGKPDGYWITYYLNGVKKSEGNRRNFLLDSTWIFYDEKGDTTEKINYVLGKRNGYFYKYNVANFINSSNINYLESKELFVNDKKEGISYYYFEDGSVKEIINYKNGKRNGAGKEFNREGNVITLYEFYNDYMIERQYVNRYNNGGQKQGTWIDLYDDGKIKSEKYYKNDTITGYAKEFNERGNVVVSLLYENGNLKQPDKSIEFSLDERIEYYENGNPKRKGFYKMMFQLVYINFTMSLAKLLMQGYLAITENLLVRESLPKTGKKKVYGKIFMKMVC
ncbi:MAG: hypothetical protein HC905_16260 [Bacteroidales bacterium]|nr:hypothetical protein [Bacteroidales bacterium]